MNSKLNGADDRMLQSAMDIKKIFNVEVFQGFTAKDISAATENINKSITYW